VSERISVNVRGYCIGPMSKPENRPKDGFWYLVLYEGSDGDLWDTVAFLSGNPSEGPWMHGGPETGYGGWERFCAEYEEHGPSHWWGPIEFPQPTLAPKRRAASRHKAPPASPGEPRDGGGDAT
jgi:hypothetical protein